MKTNIWGYWGPLHRIQEQQSIIKFTILETYVKQEKTNNKFVIYGPQCPIQKKVSFQLALN